MLLERLVQGAKPYGASSWQDHKKKAMLAMLAELPKWVKMTNPTANDAKAAAAAAMALTENPEAASTGASPPDARSLFSSTKSFSKRKLAPRAPAAPVLSSAWNVVRYLAELEHDLKRAAEAAATQPDRSPAKDARRGLLAMLLPMQWKRAHASRGGAAKDGMKPPDSEV